MPEAAERAGRAGAGADSLLHRVASAVVFVPILVFVTWVGGLPYLALISLMVALGLWEFYDMLRTRGERPYRTTGLAAGLLLVWYAQFREGVHANLLLTLVLLGLVSVALLRRDPRDALHNISGTVFGVFYVAWLGSHLVFLRSLPELAGIEPGAGRLGASMVLFLFLCAWGCDSGAYAVGSTAGRRPLLERVSPRKSVEGALGGLVAGTLLGWVGASTFATFFTPWQGAVAGLAIAGVGQLGDMVESLIKRDTSRKHSAVALVIPGHGGVLDRFDSVLFAAPMFYYIMKAIYL